MSARFKRLIIACAAVLSTTASIFAQQSAHRASDDSAGCDVVEVCDSMPSGAAHNALGFWDRPTLTGDWGGLRSHLQESGITFAGRMAHFGFGVDGGIDQLPPLPQQPLGLGDTFKYTGRSEYDFTFDPEKFGGLPYGSLLVRAEHWWGDFGSVSLNTGAFAPAVFPGLLPVVPDGEGVPYITNFVITQPLSENFVVFAGKKTCSARPTRTFSLAAMEPTSL